MRKGASGGYNKITPNRKLVRKSASRQDLRGINDKVTLKHILGLTTTNTNGLACNSVTGVIAYPAGCVIILYNPKTNIQSHISNPDKKTITCLAFSKDGKHLVSGESGQQPSVRVWDLNENLSQVAELRGHKSGITSVAFSPNNKLLVSIGDQHDMLVNVWNWKLGHTVACNKSGCRVRSVSFSETGNYLVTVGNRHVKFWYLDQEASSKGNAPITPITGRAGILGEQRNNCFTDVKCGRGKNARFTYCVTKSSRLCMFSERRIMDKWVELKAGSANCLEVTEDYIFCGCSDGLIRVFEPSGLRFVATFPRPHNLGVNVSDGLNPSDLVHLPNKGCPDLVALSVDIIHKKMTSIYNDHSLYIWDIKNIKKVGKVASFLYHSACIWGIETYPFFGDGPSPCLPDGSFLTCSSDDTIRIWNLESENMKVKTYPRNLYSKELLKIVYVDEGLANIQDTSMTPFGKDSDTKNGIRCMQISPDGQVLATGDRSGNLRIYSLEFFDETYRIEAHESEILCVEFSPEECGFKLLASSSRDRLIHIFDTTKKYALLQTIDDHSSSITAVRFNFDENVLQMLSCGADKVVMFHTAQMSDNSIHFVRNTIVPGKATLYDMGIEPTRKYAGTVGQDRYLRIYDIQGAKQTHCFKGSIGEEGNLIKFQLDSGGVYAAVSCSDKTIGIFEFENGECEASVYGHSEIATGLKFTADGKHLISVSGDGCIFIWNLPPLLTENIRNRIQDLNAPLPVEEIEEDLRRKTFVVSTSDVPPEFDESPGHQAKIIENGTSIKTPAGYRFSVGQLPLWAQKQIGGKDSDNSSKALNTCFESQPLGRWGEVELNIAEANPGMDSQYSEESSASMQSEDRETAEQEENIIYPPSNEDEISVNEFEKTFHVTESTDPSSSNEQNGDGIIDDDSESAGKESDTDDHQTSSEVESDHDEAFSPLMDHFEMLGTPAKIESQPRTDSTSDQPSQQPFIPGHRASISAKFLSRSQKSSSRPTSSSNLTAEEQRRRLENLKHKLNNPPSTNTINEPLLPPSSFTNQGGGGNAAPRAYRKASMDSNSLSPKIKARNTVSSNLRKSKMISKSCVNLSFTKELDSLRSKENFKNSIPSTPSASSIADLLTSDPRRSSTPMNINKQKWKRRSASNAWAANTPHSPLSSPIGSQPSLNTLLNGPQTTVNANPALPETAHPKGTDNVIRRTGGKKNRARPRSMLVEPVTTRDDRSEIAISRQGFIQPHSHSDTEIDDNPIENSVFVSASLPTTPSVAPQIISTTPVKNNVTREIDIDDQLSNGLLNNDLKVTINSESASRVIESSNERALRVACEINENVLHLQFQARQNSIPEGAEDEQPRDAKQLIRLYETGVIGGNGKVISASPPERDVPAIPIQVKVIDEERTEEVENVELDVNDENEIVAEELICSTVDQVIEEECTKKMENLAQSYKELTDMEDRLLTQPASDQQKRLLALINTTYDTLQETLNERSAKLKHVQEFTRNNLQVLQSDTFKEFQETLQRAKVPDKTSEDADIFNLLDKYSNVLVDMIGSKMNSKESIID